MPEILVAENLAMMGRFSDALSVLETVPALVPATGEGSGNAERYHQQIQLSRSRIEFARGDPQAAWI